MVSQKPIVEKIHKEILQTQQHRLRIDLLKVAFVVALLGFGSVKIEDLTLLRYSLYLAPAVALCFDVMSMGHTFTIRRNGKFLRENSPDELEQAYERFVASNRDQYFILGSMAFTALSFVAPVFLIRAVSEKWPPFFGWLILIFTLVLYVFLFTRYRKQIAEQDDICE